MGQEDRDWWREAQKERAQKESKSTQWTAARPGRAALRSTRLKWGAIGIAIFWLAVIGLLYAGMMRYLQPAPVIVSATGDLVIPRARDGHFYAAGTVNGKPVNFMVDTGASLVTVSEKFARAAQISKGIPTVFKTANGDLSVFRAFVWALGWLATTPATRCWVKAFCQSLKLFFQKNK